MLTKLSRPCPVIAVIVELIQSEGSDNHASHAFFQRLRELTKKRGIVAIVDEVQTGENYILPYEVDRHCGRVWRDWEAWGHEHWQLSSPPDIVSFSEKGQTAGYFCSDRLLVLIMPTDNSILKMQRSPLTNSLVTPLSWMGG